MQYDVVAQHALEAVGARLDGIRPRDKRQHLIFPRVIHGNSHNDAGGLVRHDDRCLRNHAAGRVHDPSHNHAAIDLPKRRQSAQSQNREQ